MSKPKDVVIDGVRYVPAVEAAVNMDAVIRGLIYQYWGDACKDRELQDKMQGLYVRVYDDGRGEPIEQVIADIARFVKAGAKK